MDSRCIFVFILLKVIIVDTNIFQYRKYFLYLHDHINSFRMGGGGGGGGAKTSLTHPPFVELPLPIQESERPCICV